MKCSVTAEEENEFQGTDIKGFIQATSPNDQSVPSLLALFSITYHMNIMNQ
jgi:hypothetical protein